MYIIGFLINSKIYSIPHSMSHFMFYIQVKRRALLLRCYSATGPTEVVSLLSLVSFRITRHMLSTVAASSLSNIICIGK